MADTYSLAFDLIARLGIKLGVTPLHRFPECWEYQLEDGWTIAVNAHKETKRALWGVDVPPFHAYVERHGIPVGIIHPEGGNILVGAEDALIAALRKKLEGT